jgi:hypothetical protein
MNVIKIVASSPINMALNNLFWVGCVVGRYELIWLVAPAIFCYAALLVYFGTVHINQLALPVAVGIFIDSVYTAFGVFQFEHHSVLLPLWMCTLWIAFATSLPLSLKLLGKNAYLAALTGATGFPFSYYVGYKLGAISFGLALPWVIVLVALTWAIFLPILFRLANSQQVRLREAI